MNTPPSIPTTIVILHHPEASSTTPPLSSIPHIPTMEREAVVVARSSKKEDSRVALIFVHNNFQRTYSTWCHGTNSLARMVVHKSTSEYTMDMDG